MQYNLSDIKKFLYHAEHLKRDREITKSKLRANSLEGLDGYMNYFKSRARAGTIRLTNLLRKKICFWGQEGNSTHMAYSIVLDEEDLDYLVKKYSSLLPELIKNQKQKEYDKLMEQSEKNQKRLEELEKEIHGK